MAGKRLGLLMIGTVAMVVLGLAIVAGAVAIKHARQYAVIDDYIAAHQSIIGSLGTRTRTTTACRAADGTGVSCRAVQYAISSKQCAAIGRSLLGVGRCNAMKTVEFEGHTLNVFSGPAYPGHGDILTVAFVR